MNVIGSQRFSERGHEVREIARRLGRAPSTISRELSRNRVSRESLTYDSDVAHALATQRARRPKQLRLYVDAELREEVAKMLRLQWSPEQIAATLRRLYPHRRSWHICHETIYQALYRPDKGALGHELTRQLRTARPIRRLRRCAVSVAALCAGR